MGVKKSILKAYSNWFKESYKIFKMRMFKHTRLASTMRAEEKKGRVIGNEVINYINYGVKGHGRGKFKSKARVKNIRSDTPYRFKKFGPPQGVLSRYNIEKNKNGLFLISRAIGRFGLESRNFIDKEVKKSFTDRRANENLKKEIVKAFNNR